jgi:hypothetical protein
MLVLSFDILATQSPEARYRLAEAGKLYKAQEDIVIESGGSGAALCRGLSFRVAFRVIFAYNRQNKLMIYGDVRKNPHILRKIFLPASTAILRGFCNIFQKKYKFWLA